MLTTDDSDTNINKCLFDCEAEVNGNFWNKKILRDNN